MHLLRGHGFRSVVMMCEEIGRLNINNTGKKSKAALRL
jgi:hypothetical protein